MNAQEIVEMIRGRIVRGELSVGDPLPTVRALRDDLGVSQQTASAAYATLAALGLVRTERGSTGTRVAAGKSVDARIGRFSPPDVTAGTAWGPTDGEGETTGRVTHVRQSTADTRFAEYGIPEGSQVVERLVVRSVDGVPAQFKATILPYDVAARVPEGGEGVAPMLAPVGAPPVKAPNGVRVAEWLGWGVVHEAGTVTVEPMPDEAAEALGLTKGAPGFRVVSVARDAAGATVFVSVTITPLHHRLTFEIVTPASAE